MMVWIPDPRENAEPLVIPLYVSKGLLADCAESKKSAEAITEMLCRDAAAAVRGAMEKRFRHE